MLKVDALARDGATARRCCPSYGGKITTYRKLAEAALRELAAVLSRHEATRGPRSDVLPGGDLPGGDRNAYGSRACRALSAAIADAAARDLAKRHGTRATAVLGDAKSPADLGREFGARISPSAKSTTCVRHEWARSADDVLWRRTKCGLAMTAAQRDALVAHLGADVVSTCASDRITSVCLFCGANVGTRAAYAQAAARARHAARARKAWRSSTAAAASA